MKLGDRLNIHHAVELSQRLHLAKRQPYLDGVGQAGKPGLNRCLRLAKPWLLTLQFNSTHGELGGRIIARRPMRERAILRCLSG